MSSDQLLAACVAAPDDDAPRLVWADAIGGERGEFVVVQCMLARDGLTPRESARLRQRQRELLAKHGEAWCGLKTIAIHVTFRRGFVEAATMPYAQFVAQAEDIFARAPLLQTLSPSGFSQENDQPPHPIERLRAVLATPAVTRLTGLVLDDIRSVREYRNAGEYFWVDDSDLPVEDAGGHTTEYGPEVSREVGQRLLHLRAFGTQGSGLARVLHQAGLSQVERLQLRESCTPDELFDLFATMPKLHALELFLHLDLPAILPRLPAGIRELSLCISKKDVPALRTMSCLSSLERLQVSLYERGTELRDLSLFHAMPRLRSLLLSHVPIYEGADETAEGEAVEQLLATPLPALRELALFRSMAPANARRVLELLGPQLERVDLGANHRIREDRTLDALVAGEIVRGPSVDFPATFAVGGDAPEPWTRDGDVFM